MDRPTSAHPTDGAVDVRDPAADARGRTTRYTTRARTGRAGTDEAARPDWCPDPSAANARPGVRSGGHASDLMDHAGPAASRPAGRWLVAASPLDRRRMARRRPRTEAPPGRRNARPLRRR